MYFIDVIRGKNITFVYHKILYNMKEEELIEQRNNGRQFKKSHRTNEKWQ